MQFFLVKEGLLSANSRRIIWRKESIAKNKVNLLSPFYYDLFNNLSRKRLKNLTDAWSGDEADSEASFETREHRRNPVRKLLRDDREAGRQEAGVSDGLDGTDDEAHGDERRLVRNCVLKRRETIKPRDLA